MVKKKIYLAIPYTGIEIEAFNIVNKVAGELMNQGHLVYSPISHSHSIAKACDLNTTWKYWKEVDEEFIKWCDKIIFVVIGEYGMNLINKSKGCREELKLALKLNKEFEYYYYKD
jgi:hypothetical protein